MTSWLPAFLAPGRLWALLLIPAIVAAYVLASRFRNRVAIRFTNTGVLNAVVPRQSQWRRHLIVGLSLLSLAFLTLAWARPQGVDKVPRERATVVLVLDVSQSMAATDVKPNRLDAEKSAAISFLKQLPPTFNASVVSLSGNPAVKLPPSTDRAQAQRAIEGLALQDSTAIGDAIYAALSALDQAPRAAGDTTVAPGAIVLLSDGENTAGQSPQQAAADAKKRGVPIYTIAYGTDNGYVDLDGERHVVAPDRPLLAQLAKNTGAQSWDAASASGLDRVYRSIRSVVAYEDAAKEVTALWAGYGLAFAVLAALGAVSLGARWP